MTKNFIRYFIRSRFLRKSFENQIFGIMQKRHDRCKISFLHDIDAFLNGLRAWGIQKQVYNK
jgi:hypothetical protein